MKLDGRRILVVLDDAALARQIRHALEGAGRDVRVRVAGTLEEYRRMAASDPPDIVIAAPAAEALQTWELLRDLKRLEAELEQRDAKLGSIFNASPMGIGMVVHRVFQEVNDTMLRMTGYSREELIGKSARILYPSDEEFNFVGSEKYRQIVDSGTGAVECRWMRKDGGILDVVLASSVLDRSDLGKGVTFTALDITARKRAEEALRESEAKFRELTRQFHGILDSFPDNIMQQSRDLRVTWSNRSAILASRAARGIAEGAGQTWDPVGQYCYYLWHGRSIPCDPCPVLQTFRTGEPSHGIAASSDGKEWELRTIPVTENGEVKEVIEIGRDITESRRMEDQLRQARHMEALGRLAGGIAHDFNNMLNVILGYSEIAVDRLGPGSPILPFLEEILRAGRRSATLVSQLLAFSRRQIVAPKVVRLNDAVSEQMTMLKRMIGEDVRVDFLAGSDLWNIRIDPSQVAQILANLAVNARDAIEGVGAITVETSNISVDEAYQRTHRYAMPGEYVRLTFRDTGSGMDAETLSHIFEPFFTTKAPGRGTGLGLATVYGIVKQNDGFINVYSEPGAGSTFRIYFPRVREEIGIADESEPEGLPSGDETVLLVEDEEQILLLAAEILENQGYRVLPAASPEAACGLADAHDGEIHLLLTDVIMPGMNGRELQRMIERRNPGIRTLFISGYTEDAVVHRGILDPGVSFLPKPFTMRQLVEKVRSVLDR